MTESFHVYYPSNHNISPGIFVMAPPISWQQTYSLSLADFPSASNYDQLHQEIPSFQAQSFWPSAVYICILSIRIREISHRFEGIGFKLSHICNCIIKRSGVPNYNNIAAKIRDLSDDLWRARTPKRSTEANSTQTWALWRHKMAAGNPYLEVTGREC